MVLVDTSVWIDHFRKTSTDLSSLLNQVHVTIHPFIVGELACGNLKNRHEILSLLTNLPQTTIAENEEVLSLVENKHLMGQGIGWIDAHLLASALISGTPLWTKDKNLRTLSAALGILY